MTEFTGRPKSEGHTPQKPKRTKAEDQELIDISQQISKNLETASFVNNRRMVEGIFGREKADELIAEADAFDPDVGNAHADYIDRNMDKRYEKWRKRNGFTEQELTMIQGVSLVLCL